MDQRKNMSGCRYQPSKKNTEPNSRTLRSKEVSVKKYEILGLKKILNVPFSNIDISLQLFFFSHFVIP